MFSPARPSAHCSLAVFARTSLDRSSHTRQFHTARLQAPFSAVESVPSTRMAQAVNTALTESTCFLVCSIRPTADADDTVRSTLSSVADLVKNVSFRDSDAALTCVAAIGSDAWDRVTKLPRPSELRPFPVINGQTHSTVSTPGDLLFHIKAKRRDMCFEIERQLLASLGDAVHVDDETWGFRYFDARDLLGFVDGTANPVGADAVTAAFVGAREAAHADGSYVVIQKYLHDLQGWNQLSTEQQEQIVGRRKFDNSELEDVDPKQKSHKSLATITDAEGVEHDILRENMPFGSPGKGEFGTYFIGYSGKLATTEAMLQRMFVGDPPGYHDRILDFSRPVTGSTFFAPSTNILAGLS